MEGYIRYIKLSVDYDTFDKRKEETKTVEWHKIILKYLTKEWNITKQ